MAEYIYPYRVNDMDRLLTNFNNFRDHGKRLLRMMIAIKGAVADPNLFLLLAQNNQTTIAAATSDNSPILAIATIATGSTYAMFDLTNTIIVRQTEAIVIGYSEPTTGFTPTSEFVYVNPDGIAPDRLYQP